MTYCVGVRLNRGLVFMSDTRTNAGIDNVSSTRKMASWVVPGERAITLMSAGNLATTQAVISMLDERTKVPADRDPSILSAETMFQVARLVGRTQREVIAENTDAEQQAEAFQSTMILGGQIAGMPPRLFLIYPEGNFIEARDDAPFMQIGETKYGRPILVRVFDPDMTFEDAIKLLVVSFDSTMKANLSVGLPLDIQTYSTDSLTLDPPMRMTGDDPDYQRISTGWGESLKSAFAALPALDLTNASAAGGEFPQR